MKKGRGEREEGGRDGVREGQEGRGKGGGQREEEG